MPLPIPGAPAPPATPTQSGSSAAVAGWGPFAFTETWTRVRQPETDRNGDPIVVAPSSETQTITVTGSPTGGTFMLTFSGQTTSAIARAASAAAVKTALQALSNIDSPDVEVTGTSGGPWAVAFQGGLGGTNVPQMTATSSLTGGTAPAVVVATATAGGVVADPPELDVPGCISWPADGNGTGGNEQNDRRDTVVIGRVLMLPPDTDTVPTDQWRRGDVLYEQVGAEGDYGPNPFTGTRVLTINLRRVTG